MTRRHLLKILAGISLADAAHAAPSDSDMSVETLEQSWTAFLPKGFRPPSPVDPLVLDDGEWRRRLAPAAYEVLRREGTERAGSSPLNGEKRLGIYVCAGCDLPLFTSAMKYDSGTGWPSFFTAIAGTLAIRRDFRLLFPRTEYHCVRCGGHHGHRFEDGPPPTGLRYCNNGVALRFLPKTGAA